MLNETISAHAATPPPISLCELPEGENEPRIRDVDLAERLVFAKPAAIRQIIERNLDELRTYGDICVAVTQTSDPKGRGRPGRAFWLTEGQALVICALSRTPRAAIVRKLVIQVFMDWRHQREIRDAVHVREHHRRPPTPAEALPKPIAPRIGHRVSLAPTADPGVMRVSADLPIAVAADLMAAFTAYEATIVTGLTRVSH